MNRVWERQETGVARAIRKSGAAIARPAPGRWELQVSNGPAFSVGAVLDTGWLVLESPLPRSMRIPPAPDLLRSNAHLPGLVKFADRARGGTMSIQAEIPIGDGIDLAARLNETLDGFSHGHAIASGKPIPYAEAFGAQADCARASADPARAAARVASRALVAALRSAGWPFLERADGSISVELESDHGYRQAHLTVDPDGAFAARVGVADWRVASPPSREAAASLLLAANNGMRMARAVSVEKGERWVGRFEVRLGSSPCEAELRHVLAALSVACRHWARELKSLEHLSTAEAYLAVRGGRS
jgi:hypothetical protein